MELGTSPSATLGGPACPWGLLDGNLPSSEVGSDDEGLAAANVQPHAGWIGSGERARFEAQGGGGGWKGGG